MGGQRPGMMRGQPSSMMQQPGMPGAMPGQRPVLTQGQQPGMGSNPQPGMMQGPQQSMGPGNPQQQGQQQQGQSSTATPQSNTQSVHFQKWEADEPLGDQATIAMILYANINNPSLKTEYPNWPDRMKQIAKIWKNLPNEKRAPYVQRARENRTANRMNRGPVSIPRFLSFSGDCDSSSVHKCWKACLFRQACSPFHCRHLQTSLLCCLSPWLEGFSLFMVKRPQCCNCMPKRNPPAMLIFGMNSFSHP